MVHYRLCAFADEADPTLEGQIRAMRDNGIGLLEMRGVNGKNVSHLTPAEAREVKNILDSADIRVFSLGSPAGKTDIHDSFDKEKEQFLRLLETADIVGAECIRLFSFYGTNGDPVYRDEVLLRLSRFAELAKGHPVRLCHENEKGIYGDVADRCLEIHRALPELSAVFDPANFVQCKEDTLRAWDMLAPYVYYGHIKDARADGVVVPPGKGEGQLAGYLPHFFADGHEVLTLEPHLTKFIGRGALEAAGEGESAAEWQFPSGRAAFDFAVKCLKEILSAL